jgi:hypothetical protein
MGGRFARPDPDALALVTGASASAGTRFLVLRAEEASLVKNGSSDYLALRLTLANDVAEIAEDLGVDVGPVLKGVGHDPRIGHACMPPSYGFGELLAQEGPLGVQRQPGPLAPDTSRRRDSDANADPAALRAADR